VLMLTQAEFGGRRKKGVVNLVTQRAILLSSGPVCWEENRQKFSRTSIYQTTRRHIPEDSIFYFFLFKYWCKLPACGSATTIEGVSMSYRCCLLTPSF